MVLRHSWIPGRNFPQPSLLFFLLCPCPACGGERKFIHIKSEIWKSIFNFHIQCSTSLGVYVWNAVCMRVCVCVKTIKKQDNCSMVLTNGSIGLLPDKGYEKPANNIFIKHQKNKSWFMSLPWQHLCVPQWILLLFFYQRWARHQGPIFSFLSRAVFKPCSPDDLWVNVDYNQYHLDSVKMCEIFHDGLIFSETQRSRKWRHGCDDWFPAASLLRWGSRLSCPDVFPGYSGRCDTFSLCMTSFLPCVAQLQTSWRWRIKWLHS